MTIFDLDTLAYAPPRREEVAAAQQSGRVKWFNRLKGYGFIEPDNGGPEVFVHYSAISGDGYRNLEEGDRVYFEVADFGRGPQARNVTH